MVDRITVQEGQILAADEETVERIFIQLVRSGKQVVEQRVFAGDIAFEQGPLVLTTLASSAMRSRNRVKT